MNNSLARLFFWLAVFLHIIAAFYFAISQQQYAISGCFAVSAALLLLCSTFNRKSKK